jgi:membrane-associated phospholipid phosphatase
MAGERRAAVPRPDTPAMTTPSSKMVVHEPVEAVVDVGAAATRAATQAAARETLPTGTALARGRGAMAIAVAGLIGFGVIFGLVRTHRSEAADLAITRRFQRRRHRLLDGLMRLASWPGFPPQSRLVPPSIMAALWLLRFRVEAAFLLLGWCAAGVSTVVKAFMKRPRPVAGTDLRVVAAPLGGSSFPSGHVITYVGTYGFAAYLAHTLIRPRHVRRAVVGALAGLLALVGPSRIYQGHHWSTDVSASYLLGTSYLVGLIALYRQAKGRAGWREDVERRRGA